TPSFRLGRARTMPCSATGGSVIMSIPAEYRTADGTTPMLPPLPRAGCTLRGTARTCSLRRSRVLASRWAQGHTGHSMRARLPGSWYLEHRRQSEGPVKPELGTVVGEYGNQVLRTRLRQSLDGLEHFERACGARKASTASDVRQVQLQRLERLGYCLAG